MNSIPNQENRAAAQPATASVTEIAMPSGRSVAMNRLAPSASANGSNAQPIISSLTQLAGGGLAVLGDVVERRRGHQQQHHGQQQPEGHRFRPACRAGEVLEAGPEHRVVLETEEDLRAQTHCGSR